MRLHAKVNFLDTAAHRRSSSPNLPISFSITLEKFDHGMSFVLGNSLNFSLANVNKNSYVREKTSFYRHKKALSEFFNPPEKKSISFPIFQEKLRPGTFSIFFFELTSLDGCLHEKKYANVGDVHTFYTAKRRAERKLKTHRKKI